jgi:hypothetical protein
MMRKQKLSNLIVILLTSLLSVGLFQRTQIAQALPTNQSSQETNQVQASSASALQANRVHLDYSATVPLLTREQRQALETAQALGPLPGPALPAGTTAVNRFDSIANPNSQTALPSASNTLQRAAAPQSPQAPGDFTLYRNTILTNLKTASSRVGEPTVANSGPIVFETGNWYGSISSDGGVNFLYVNPYAMFPSSYGGFCCDQIVTYDPARDIFIWYLQYVSSGAPGSGQNLFRVAVASPQDAASGWWWYYDFVSAANTEYDYPDLCLSNDFLWVTTNRGPFNGSYVDDAFIFKFPLDEMSVGAGFGFSFLDLGGAGLGNLSLRCTRGAHETMYFGTHNSLSQIRILRWAENSGSIYYDNVNLSAAWFNSTHVCPGPDGRDWCGFDDGRIKAGWVSQGRIGFMWGSSQGGGFTYPYVEAVRVREDNRAYIDRPFIWGSSGAFAYPAASPNARGDLGVGFFFGGGGASGWYPYFGLAIDDDVSRDAGYPPPGWNVAYVRESSQGPTSNRWGDYISVLPFAPSGLGWIASGFTMQGCGGNYCTEPSYTIFGRARDLRSVQKYFNPNFSAFLPITRR